MFAGKEFRQRLPEKYKKTKFLKKNDQPCQNVVWSAVRRCNQHWTVAAMFSNCGSTYPPEKGLQRRNGGEDGCSWMNAANRAKNKCMKNTLCSAPNRKQLFEGRTMESSERGNEEVTSDHIDKTWGDRRREREQIGASLPLSAQEATVCLTQISPLSLFLFSTSVGFDSETRLLNV